MSLRAILRAFRRRFSRYEPLITVRLSRSNLLHNLHAYQAACPRARIAPVLKSNAYGHGLVEIASVLANEPVAFLVLDSLHEASILRSAGIRTPLLVIGYTPVDNMMRMRLADTAFTITSLSQLEELVATRARVRVHLKLDTGMHRQGLREEEWARAQEMFGTHPRLILEGICSHFADADNLDEAFTQKQYAAWTRAVSAWKARFSSIRFFHIAATSGVRFGCMESDSVVRVGLGLYGLDAAPERTLDLQPVLQLETVVSGVKELRAGESVGYNATFTTDRPMRIATIPMGYFEGIDRRLSNTGVVTVHGIACPIIGRVSMNITTIDVSNVPEATRGDHAVVLSAEPHAPNSVEATARCADTIPWEILVHIPLHLRRSLEA